MKQTEEKAKGGRKRTHLVKVYLSDEEYEKLCKDAATFNLCRMTDDDELGYLSFEIDKDRFSIRLTAPYTEERRQLARAKMIEINNKEDVE